MYSRKSQWKTNLISLRKTKMLKYKPQVRRYYPMNLCESVASLLNKQFQSAFHIDITT